MSLLHDRDRDEALHTRARPLVRRGAQDHRGLSLRSHLGPIRTRFGSATAPCRGLIIRRSQGRILLGPPRRTRSCSGFPCPKALFQQTFEATVGATRVEISRRLKLRLGTGGHWTALKGTPGRGCHDRELGACRRSAVGPVDGGQLKLPACGQINPRPSDRLSTVPSWCIVERREGRLEERKRAGGDHRPLRGAGQLSVTWSLEVTGLPSSSTSGMARWGHRAHSVAVACRGRGLPRARQGRGTLSRASRPVRRCPSVGGRPGVGPARTRDPRGPARPPAAARASCPGGA
jgi:hypothetical protein